MFTPIARTALGLAGSVFVLRPRTDPEFAAATWLAGARPGQLLAAETISPIGLGGRMNPAKAWRISYATSDRDSRVLSATGAVFRSLSPWRGEGEAPTVAFAPSTQGVAPRCDPSYTCTVGFSTRRSPLDAIAAYEQPAINLLLACGANVVVTDYPRDPEDNVQLYCDHVSSARALADALRASSELGIDTTNLGLWGFSQGGGAVGAWLEQPEYTPELQPLAAVVGAPPADLIAMLDHVDGAMSSVVILYAVAALMAADERIAGEITPYLSGEGVRAVMLGAQVCAAGAVLHRPWAQTSTWTTTGQTMAELLADLPLTSAHLEASRLGSRRPPRIPIRLWASLFDDLVPHPTVTTLGSAWGVDVHTRRLPRILGRTGMNHFGPYFAWLSRDVRWLLAQLGG
ncbi:MULTISPECIES: lipase family protein [Corynebacterium]|uniref:lipase family protein n=1 Tax=Corynebacterium TaxID=1716 RepID=UPI0008A596F2|nr:MULTISPECIES: lipase family protein [Corynebacterium]OFT75708.1 lipase [Corynebacterium sp. HMSC30G07]